MFEIFGAEGLRRSFVPVSFLVQRLALEWDASALEDMTELRRIHENQQNWHDRPWAKELICYINELQGGGSPPLKARTVRMYQGAAARFVEAANVPSLSAITQTHLNRHMKRYPGQNANLGAFVGHLRRFWNVNLQVPKKTPTSLSKKDRTLVTRVNSLTRDLETVSDPRRARALIAALVAALYQVHLKDVLALSHKDVSEEDDALVLWPATHEIRIDGRLGEMFRRWLLVPGADGLLFVGRNGLQPMSDHAVRHHLHVSRAASPGAPLPETGPPITRMASVVRRPTTGI